MKTSLLLLSLALLGTNAMADATKTHDDRMVKMERADAPAPDSAGGETVAYHRADGVEVKGTFFKAAKPRKGSPAVVVIHEWWGLNDEIRGQAKELAAAGFHTLAVDLYKGQVATEPETARKLATVCRGAPDAAVANLQDAAAWLRQRTRARKVGVIGWCMGGGFSLELALRGKGGVQAAVMYYGQVKTSPDDLKLLEAPVLGVFGGKDQAIPLDGVRRFEAAMKAAGKALELHVYPEAGHAFANPTRMESYRAADAADAWKHTLAFLRRQLRSGG